MFDEHFYHEPNRRMSPPYTGEVDTTQMGGIYDVQNMHGHCDPHCGYHIPTIPPLSPIFGAMTESEQLRDLAKKVNELCGTIEGYNHKVEDAYKAIINSALCNDSYYKEVTVENGYIPESGSNYKIVHIPFLDRANQPIFFELGLAYDNTTNSGVKEGCFDASQRFIADKMIPAQNTGDSFIGTVTWKGAPIYSEAGDSYTFAVTQNGFFKGYKNATPEVLKQDKIRNSCGARGILVYNKALATESFPEDASTMRARIAVGQNYDTKERFLIVVDGGESVGCTSEQLANLFIKYGCMIAIELVSGASVYGMDKGAMMYAPVVADEYDTPSVPVSNAFWYITKRRHYHNEYVKDVALLMQKMGEEIWRRLILNEQTDFVKKSVVELKKALNAEIENRKTEDERIESESKARDEILQNNLDKEVARLDERCDTIESESKERDNELNELILTKERESKERDEQLQVNINNEAETRFEQDVQKVGYVDDGDKRTYSLYRNDNTKIPENIEVYEYNKLIAQFVTMAQIAENLKTETSERKKADADLQSQITDEISNRTNAVNDLQSQITKEISDRTNADTILQNNIDNEATARKNKDDNLQTQIDDLANESTGEIAKLRSELNTETNNRISGDNLLTENLTTETNNRVAEDNAIKALIQAEKTTRENKDTELADSIDNLITDYEKFKNDTTNDLDAKKVQIEAIAADVANIRAVVDTHATQMASINATITALQTTISTMETSLENMKQSIANIQTAFEEFKVVVQEAIDSIKKVIDNLDSVYVRLDAIMSDTELKDVLDIFESI